MGEEVGDGDLVAGATRLVTKDAVSVSIVNGLIARDTVLVAIASEPITRAIIFNVGSNNPVTRPPKSINLVDEPIFMVYLKNLHVIQNI